MVRDQKKVLLPFHSTRGCSKLLLLTARELATIDFIGINRNQPFEATALHAAEQDTPPGGIGSDLRRLWQPYVLGFFAADSSSSAGLRFDVSSIICHRSFNNNEHIMVANSRPAEDSKLRSSNFRLLWNRRRHNNGI